MVDLLPVVATTFSTLFALISGFIFKYIKDRGMASAIQGAVKLGLNYARNSLPSTQVEIKNDLARAAAQYVLKRYPGFTKSLKLDEDSLVEMAIARIAPEAAVASIVVPPSEELALINAKIDSISAIVAAAPTPSFEVAELKAEVESISSNVATVMSLVNSIKTTAAKARTRV